jgi:hypothetical protein
METRSARGQGRGRGIPLPTQGRDTIDPPIVPLPLITPTYNLVHSSRGMKHIFELPRKFMYNTLEPSLKDFVIATTFNTH